ncbi:hypothetical protein EVA_15964 [gut metagenome]|uniref:Uncharacterized protein n=1 Tax=gut metagenome TaxID=749906 RepID=J9C7U2_9ZZZZ
MCQYKKGKRPLLDAVSPSFPVARRPRYYSPVYCPTNRIAPVCASEMT